MKSLVKNNYGTFPLYSLLHFIYIYIYSVLDQLALDSVLKTKMIFGNHFLKYSVLLFNIIKNKLNGKVALQQG